MQRITSFGGVEVRDHDGELLSFRSRKHVALLVYLRSNPRRVHRREIVARLFWETESSLARHSLSQALYDIRSTLGPVITNVPGDALRMEADRVGFDVDELERAVRNGDLSHAVDLYTAPFAPDLDRAGTEEFERWLEQERGRLAVLGQTALRQFLTYADNRGEWGEMCSAALRLIRMNPLDEEAHRALMRGLWLHGDQTSALEHFREVRERLEGELPQGLSQETLELVRRIERSRPRAVRSEMMEDRSIPLVGRQRELELLGEFAEEPAESEEVLVIQGEAGIGKTRLVEELEKLLTLEGFEILRSHCYAAEAEVPYGPILDGLREVAAQIDDLPGSGSYLELGRLFPFAAEAAHRPLDATADGQSARRRLFEEIADMLRRYAARKPVVWIVEDLHNIDGASSALLHYLARRLAARPFRLVITTRPESDQSGGARKLLSEEAFVDQSRRCVVERLSVESVGELMEHLTDDGPVDPSLVEKVANLSGGNPFYAVELSKAIDRSSSVSIEVSDFFTGKLRTILAARLKGLDAAGIHVLEALCVAAPHCQPITIKKILDCDFGKIADAVDALEAVNIIRAKSERLVFVHDIFREYVYDNIGLVRKAALHLATAEVLAGDIDVAAWTVARHFGEGGDSLRAFEYSLRAAREADRTSACEEAVSIAQYGQKHARTPAEKLQILTLLARSQVTCGHLNDAIATYQTIIESSIRSGNLKATVDARLRLADAYVGLAEWEKARRTLANLGGLLPNSVVPDSEWLDEKVEQLRLQIMIAIWSRNYAAAREEFSQLQSCLADSIQELSDVTLLKATYAVAAYQMLCGSLRAASHCLETAEERMRRCSDSETVQQIMILRSAAEEKLGHWDAAEYWLSQFLDHTRRHHDVLAEAKASNNLACLALGKGDWEKARSYISTTLTLAGTLSVSATVDAMARVNEAKLFLYQGRYGEATRGYKVLLEMLKANRQRINYFEPEIRGGLALAALPSGNTALAINEWKQLEQFGDQELTGVQEAFIVHWLRSFMNKQINAKEAESRLTRAVALVRATDRVSALKLEWIREVVFRGGSAKSRGGGGKVLEDLKTMELYWFARFLERWYRSSLQSMHSSTLIQKVNT